MAYRAAWCTDVGIRKEINQDSALLIQADSSYGPLLMAAICDGMGGLSKGEVASACVIERLKEWFMQELPRLLMQAEFQAALYHSWNSLIEEQNRIIASYGRQHRLSLGTTVVILLLIGDAYYIMHVGDSRIYLLSDQAYQLTHDQTLAQKAVDDGRMTQEEARRDSRRNVLLQCVGASEQVTPEMLLGETASDTGYLLCCDGFCHEISPEEIYGKLSVSSAPSQQQMQQGLQELVELNKTRQEKDNITALLIHI